MNNGWVKLYRSSLQSTVWQDPTVWRVWSWCLMKANHEPNKFLFNREELVIEAGQFVTGINVGKKECKITAMQWRRAVDVLKLTNRVAIKTTNKFTIVTIINWDKYQLISKQDNKRITNKEQTNSKRITTNNKDNKDNNIKNNTGRDEVSSPSTDVVRVMDIFYKTINPSLNYGNKTIRGAAEWLISKYGTDKAVELAEAAISIQGQKYSPLIKDPLQLKNKLADLFVFIKKEKSNSPKGIVL